MSLRSLLNTVTGLVAGVATLAGGARAVHHGFDGSDDVQWSRPVHYQVQTGDTLSAIASVHGVRVADLRDWNALKGNTLEPGEVLLVWTSVSLGFDEIPDTEEGITKGAPRRTHASASAHSGASARAVPSYHPRVTIGGGSAYIPASADGADDYGPVNGDEYAEDYLAMRRYLGKADFTITAELHSSTSMDSAASSLYGGDRGALGSGGEVGKGSVGYRSSGGGSMPSAASLPTVSARAPRLSMPAAKRCLAGPSDADLHGDNAMAASAGLSEAQVRSAMDRFIPNAMSCMGSGSHFSGTISTEILVGCDGRVKDVDVDGSGGIPADVVSCIEKTLAYAPFPAHDMPDGFSFGYQVHVSR